MFPSDDAHDRQPRLLSCILRLVPPAVILLVEDHTDTREMYSVLFSAAGFSTVEVATAENALPLAANIRPAVIVTDLRLGAGADGLDLCEQLKEDPATKDIPVIILTGWTLDKTHRARAEAAGCGVMLLKPITPDALVTAVLKVLQSQPTTE